ncbi:4'-phosphopantetheinyl transferase superfamily protein [Rhodanobacter sp. C05]|uniref:4'-phosphopantetheinyl transferase family protein n=1 Tax=Rhodanobacter sp. C05 TaxID=1945855 RepID=UPI000985590C|nr:4'-phosphopantetheinyl transferase superfamily protein [Rhodanobacter sp. C05]OOG43697.1 4-phosphopantetheinyl transferase [Rhodanobacter sp. C05]
MTTTHAQTLASLAGCLRDDEIHVWHLTYQATQGRAPLRRVLAAYLGIDADAVALVAGEHGRPALAAGHDQSLGFNWSHSGDQALIAIGRHVSPGIDVERRRERPRALEIAQRYFSVDEAAALAALPAANRSAAFLELWTAKEAVLKALGHGIAFGLHRLSIANASEQLILLQLEDDDVLAWQLRRLPVDTTLLAALAWRGLPRQILLGTLASMD